MITVNVNDIDYLIPESWNEVTVKMQAKAIENVSINPKDIDNYLLNISAYTGIPFELLANMDLADFEELILPMSFLKEEPQTPLITEFLFRGHTYHVLKSLEKAKVREYTSCQAVLGNYKDNPVAALPTLIAIVAKRENETMDDYDLDSRSVMFEDLPYIIAQGIYLFFCACETLYTQSLEASLRKQDSVMQASMQYSKNILKGWAGTGLLKRLLRAILLLSVKFWHKRWESFFNSALLENTEGKWKKQSKKFFKVD